MGLLHEPYGTDEVLVFGSAGGADWFERKPLYII